MDSPLRPLPKLNDDSLLADLSIVDDDSFLPTSHPLGLPPPARPPRAPGHGEESHPADAAANPSSTDPPSSREEHLRTSLAELRRMNTVFDGFLTSLEASRGHAERLATKAAHSRALLAQYVTLMGQTHHTQELLLNTRWTGVKDDEIAHREAEDARIKAQEEAEARAVAEAERLAQEERDAEERAAVERERAARGRGGSAGRGRGRGRVPSATGIPTRTARPSSAGGRKYDHVQSSGYGPRRT